MFENLICHRLWEQLIISSLLFFWFYHVSGMEPSAKTQQPSKADRVRAIMESIYKEERKVCSPQPAHETQGCACRPPTTPEKSTDAPSGCTEQHSPRLGHRIPETSRPLELPSSREQSQEWSDSSTINSVPTPVCLQLLSLIFKPLKTEQETLRIPHAETANVLHNKPVVIKRYFLHNAFRDLSPLPLNNIRSYDSGFQQLRWSKHVYTEYRNNPCLSKQAKMKTSSSDLHPPSQVCLT